MVLSYSFQRMFFYNTFRNLSLRVESGQPVRTKYMFYHHRHHLKPAADLCDSMQFSTHAIKIASNRSFDCTVCGGLRRNFQRKQQQLHGSNMFDIFHTLLQFIEGNCFFSRRCVVNARQHATENLQTTNERLTLQHVSSSLDSKMVANIARNPWTPEKEEALVAIWKLNPAFMTHLGNAENELLGSFRSSPILLS